MQLDQEKFNTVKELADISQQLSDARAALKKLEETTEEYMVVREKEAEDRVVKVLRKSREALEEATKNHNELSSFKEDLKAFANKINLLSTDIIALFKGFSNRMNEADNDMVEHRKNVNEVLKKIKIERVQVQEDRKLLEGEKKKIDEQHRLLKDKREALERAWDELRRIKNKNI